MSRAFQFETFQNDQSVESMFSFMKKVKIDSSNNFENIQQFNSELNNNSQIFQSIHKNDCNSNGSVYSFYQKKTGIKSDYQDNENKISNELNQYDQNDQNDQEFQDENKNEDQNESEDQSLIPNANCNLVRNQSIDLLMVNLYYYGQKRATVYKIIYLIDKILQDYDAISQTEYHLIQAASILICSKYEEIFPVSINKIINTFQENLEKQKILQKELEIFKKIKFKINFTTIISDFDELTKNWDQNLKNDDTFLSTFLSNNLLYFRSKEQQSILNYQNSVSYLDAIIFEKEFYNMDPTQICISIIYLFMKMMLSEIIKFQNESFDWQTLYQVFFENFLQKYNLIKLNELKCIEFVGKYFNGTLTLEKIIQIPQFLNHEDYLQSHFYNPYMMDCINSN